MVLPGNTVCVLRWWLGWGSLDSVSSLSLCYFLVLLFFFAAFPVRACCSLLRFRSARMICYMSAARLKPRAAVSASAAAKRSGGILTETGL